VHILKFASRCRKQATISHHASSTVTHPTVPSAPAGLFSEFFGSCVSQPRNPFGREAIFWLPVRCRQHQSSLPFWIADCTYASFMTDIEDTLHGLSSAGRTLGDFAGQLGNWDPIAGRLNDASDGLEAAKLSLDVWRKKFDVRKGRQDRYLPALFGGQGSAYIDTTLENIHTVTEAISEDVNRITHSTLELCRGLTEASPASYQKHGIQDHLIHIRKSSKRSRNFMYSILRLTEPLEGHLHHLHHNLTVLERLSDYYLESRHPNRLLTITRLPGRRTILTDSDPRHSTIQQKLDGNSARRDASLLYRATDRYTTTHIGISVPMTHRRDFAFLVQSGAENEVTDILVCPIRINNPSIESELFHSVLSTAMPFLRERRKCYILPSATSRIAFELSVPPSTLLSSLRYKFPLSQQTRSYNTYTKTTTGGSSLSAVQQMYPQDQTALICAIAKGCWRLIGTRWLDHLCATNVRSRRSQDGRWTCMLSALPSSTSPIRAFDHWVANTPTSISSQFVDQIQHIFRIGLVLAEIALQLPVLSSSFTPTQSHHQFPILKIYIESEDGEEVELDVHGVVAEVERRTNVLVGNIVFACLNILCENSIEASERTVEGMYYRDVLTTVGLLEELRSDTSESANVSMVGTPGSSRDMF